MDDIYLQSVCQSALAAELGFNTSEDIAAAINRVVEAEGWAVFNADESPEIQRDDEMDVFPHDEAAEQHVATLARMGSNVHRLALALHRGWRD